MKSVTDDDLNAYLDGALSPERSREVASEIARNSELRGRLESYELQRKGLATLYRDVVDEPIPERLLDILYKKTPKH